MQERDAQAPFLLEKSNPTPIRIHREISDVDMAVKVAEEEVWTREREIELLREAKAGNQEAVGELWGHYDTQVYSYVRGRLGDHHRAEDVVSDVGLKFVRYIDRYEDRGIPLGAYLRTIARNEIVSFVKREKCRPSSNSVALHNGVIDNNSLVDPHKQAELMIEVDRVKSSLFKLSANQRNAIRFRIMHDMDYEEISRKTGRTATSIRVDLCRGLKKLKELLKDPNSKDAAQETDKDTNGNDLDAAVA